MAVLANEKILTLDYWKPASKIEVGDYIFNIKGEIVRVKSVQSYMPRQCYTVNLSDYMTVSGDGNLVLPIETRKYRNRVHSYKGKHPFRRPLKLIPLVELKDYPIKNRYDRHDISVPTCQPLKLPHQDLLVPPFVFGFWFKNKNFAGNFHVEPNLLDYIEEKFQDSGYEFIKLARNGRKSQPIRFLPTVESHLAPNIPTQIPNNYLLASEEQRLELLRGIIAASPKFFISKNNWFKVSSASWQEIHRIQGLVESLGCKTKLEQDSYHKGYRLLFKTRHILHPEQTPPKQKVHQDRRYVKLIEEIPAQMCVHIETDEPNGTFLIGEGFIACR